MTAGVPDAEGAGDTVTVGGFVTLHAPPKLNPLAGTVMPVIVPLVIQAVAVAVTPPTPVGASSVTVGAVAAV